MDRGISTKSNMPSGAIVSGFLQVGDAIVDCGACRIINREPQIKITPKVLAVVLELARNEGETVARDTLLDTVWAGTSPTPDVVKQAMLEIRRAFKPLQGEDAILETIPRLGYRLLVKTKYSETLDGLNIDNEDHIADIGHKGSSVPSYFSPQFFTIVWVLVILVLGLVWYFKNTGDVGSVARNGSTTSSNIVTYRLLSSDVGAERFPSVSADGSMIAFTYTKKIADHDALVTKIVNDKGIELLELAPDSTTGSYFPFPVWSPDGSEIAVNEVNDEKASCQIKSFPISGGPGRTLSKCWPELLQHFDWSPDGKQLALSGMPDKAETPLGKFYRYSIDDDLAVKSSYGDDTPHFDLEPKYSPDGKKILFRRGIQPHTNLYIFDVNDNSIRQLTNFGTSLRGYDWTADGRHVIFSSNHLGVFALYALNLSDKTITPLGIEDAQSPNVSAKSNVLVFQKTRLKTTIAEASLLDVALEPTASLPQTTASDRLARVSPVSDAFAFISNRSGVDQVWLTQNKGKPAYQLTQFAGERLESLSWSDDGKNMLVIAIQNGSSRVFEINVERQKTSPISFKQEIFLQNVAYGAEKNSLLMIARDHESSWGLWSARRNGKFGVASPEKVMDGAISFALVPLEGGYIWVNRISGSPIEIYDRHFKLIRKIKLPGAISTLKYSGKHVWYVSLNEGNTGLRSYSLIQEVDIFRANLENYSWVNTHFDISNDETRAFYTRTVQDDTDIAIAELPEHIR